MNVLVTCDHHFERTPDGQVWANGPLTYSFWTRYLPVFDSARLITRIRDVKRVASGQEPANGDGITFAPVPDFTGPQQYLLRALSVRAAVAKAVQNRDAVMLRAPGVLSTPVGAHMLKSARPYGVEVVTDPYDVFAPGAIRHPLRPFFRWRSTRILRRLCAGACAAAYVTREALQRRYPAGAHAYSTYYSDVLLPEGAFANEPRTRSQNGRVRLVFVGTLAQLYKSPEVLIDAVGACAREGLQLELALVGDGRYRSELEARAKAFGLNGAVQFRGQLASADAVRAEFDRADLFVLPSRQEGMPRAMLEAMARGLPCIGSTVGGIPELLPAEDLVPPGDVSALARKIREVSGDPARMARMSARNLATAREYRPDALSERRNAFYEQVRDQTDAWLRE